MAPPYLLIFKIVRRGMYWWGLKYINVLRWFCGAKATTTIDPGVDLSRPYVYISNHLSYLDIAVVMTSIPIWWRFIAMKKLRYVPVFGGVMKDLGNIFIDRSTTEKAYRSIDAAAKRIAGGQSILVYPEGGLSRGGRIKKFKKGGFNLALRAGVPVVPVIMRRTNEVLSIPELKSKAGAVYCDLLKPIPTNGRDPKEAADFAEEVRQVMIAAKASLDEMSE